MAENLFPTSRHDLQQVDRRHGFRHWLSLHYKKVTWTSLTVAVTCLMLYRFAGLRSPALDIAYAVGLIAWAIFFLMYVRVLFGVVWFFGYRTELWKTYRSQKVEHIEKTILLVLWLIIVFGFLFVSLHPWAD
jgi:hypothetical protein